MQQRNITHLVVCELPDGSKRHLRQCEALKRKGKDRVVIRLWGEHQDVGSDKNTVFTVNIKRLRKLDDSIPDYDNIQGCINAKAINLFRKSKTLFEDYRKTLTPKQSNDTMNNINLAILRINK